MMQIWKRLRRRSAGSRNVEPRRRGLQSWLDPVIAFGLFAGYLTWLLATVRELGYARDEGFYFHAARTYGKWFELLWSDPSRALQASVVDQYWKENSEHPALMKSLFWLSHRAFGSSLVDTGTAFRFPAMVLSAAAVATTFVWGRQTAGRAGGIVAAAAFGLMPRVFHHSHLSCFDMPIVSLWLMTAYAYHQSWAKRSIGWAIASALLFGLALDTKHNSWFLPPAIVAHVLVCHAAVLYRRGARPWWRVLRIRIPLAGVLMAVLGPLVFYAGWPWIWRDTVARLAAYVKFHTQHVYYNMEFLGQTYFEPPFPRSYAWVMTLATVPAVTWVLSVCGVAVALVTWIVRLRSSRQVPDGAATLADAPENAPEIFWAIAIAANYSFWWLDTTPIFGGTKHWLTAYPFLGLFAGQGFAWLSRALSREIAAFGAHPRLASAGLAASVIAGPLAMTWHSYPWGLSAYVPLVGGASGAATLGLNRTFWGYATGALTEAINEAPKGARVFVHDTAMDSFRMLQKDGRIRRDIKPWWTVAGSQLSLYHHEQHMSRVEHMIWTDYGTTAPAHIGAFDGVPVTWLYRRPGGP